MQDSKSGSDSGEASTPGPASSPPAQTSPSDAALGETKLGLLSPVSQSSGPAGGAASPGRPLGADHEINNIEQTLVSCALSDPF